MRTRPGVRFWDEPDRRRPYTTSVGSAGSCKYILSLPERVVRSLGALCGGLLREVGNVALPATIRRTTLYRTMVDVALQFLIEEVGQVEGIYPSNDRLAEKFLLRRTASHGIELLGILAFQASPIWVLAALADATGAGRKLIQEVAQELQQEGLLEPDARFETMEQVLDGLERTSAHLANTLNLPPVDVGTLRSEWGRLKEELQSIPPKRIPAIERVERVWGELKQAANEQNRPVFVVSSALALSAIARLPANVLWLSRAGRSAARRTGRVFGEAILDHYSDALHEMNRTGFVRYWSAGFRPYLRGAAEQFAREHPTLTEQWLSR